MNRILGKIRKAAASDFQSILQLLEVNELPKNGVQEHLHQFLVWDVYPKHSSKSRIGGCVGMELYGKSALLRSLSIHPEYQSKRIGTQLLNSIFIQAVENHIDNLFLLTTTADSYFVKHGFTRISRDDVPATVKESVEFQSACPSSAICMTKKL